jgi:flavin-binding protein dodecin
VPPESIDRGIAGGFKPGRRGTSYCIFGPHSDGGHLREDGMDDHVYRIIEITGSSQKSIEDAIQTAVTRASKTLRNLRWFEVIQSRGQIENGKVSYYQAVLKVGFTVEDA